MAWIAQNLLILMWQHFLINFKDAIWGASMGAWWGPTVQELRVPQ